MPEKFTIELTEDQVCMVGYALKEMGSRRLEQSIEGVLSTPACREDAQKYFCLSRDVYELLQKRKPQP